MDAKYIERQGRTRDVLFARAMAEAEKDGKVWNDLSGDEREMYVALVEQAWIAQDTALVREATAQLAAENPPREWGNITHEEKLALLTELSVGG